MVIAVVIFLWMCQKGESGMSGQSNKNQQVKIFLLGCGVVVLAITGSYLGLLLARSDFDRGVQVSPEYVPENLDPVKVETTSPATPVSEKPMESESQTPADKTSDSCYDRVTKEILRRDGNRVLTESDMNRYYDELRSRCG